MTKIKKIAKETVIEAYSHKGQKRKNNPPVGLVSSATDKLDGRTKYSHDPHIDPYLSWAGKKEGTEFEVQNVSLHIHERIDPKRIIKSFFKKDKGPRQISLFEQPDNEPPLNKAIDFYKHEQDWTNRLIVGDSLLVMNSLLNKEGMAGKVQMVYIDPPYGIKYNSNFQPFVNKKDVKDRDEDIPAEPEMIQAFRDTWELGIHSYLSHLRDRLLLAKELLHESGSVFVQISDENVHHVRELMDEIFQKENFSGLISFVTTSGFESKTIPRAGDYVIWYARERSKMKYHQLYKIKTEYTSGYNRVELPDGTRRSLASKEKNNLDLLPKEARIYSSGALFSPGASSEVQEFEFNGKKFVPPKGSHWKTTIDGLSVLAKANRIEIAGNTLRYVRYLDDFSAIALNNVWKDTQTFTEKIYVVQTNPEIIKRCMLMSTDPGDLVFDPTCGSGATAYVAEEWGRRWITCDTSRVSITLAKQRLMTSKFDYYELAHKDEGLKSGFNYKKIQHITLKSIAQGEPSKEETLYDQPLIEKNKVRVTGSFTVEAVPCLRVKPIEGSMPKVDGLGRELSQTGETGNQSLWRDELKASGIRATGGKTISFSRIELMIATRFLHAEGEILEKGNKNKVAYISFGPEYGPLEQRQVEEAIKEARNLKKKPDFVIFAAFHFDPEAAKDIDQIKWSGVKILKSQMSVDLLTLDLRKKRSTNQSYWLIGQPDIEVIKEKKGEYKVKINGFDYYNPISGEIESKDNKNIAMWFLDTDYDERSLLPDQVFFPMKDSKRDWTKLSKALNGEVDEELLDTFTGTESLSFKAGKEKKIAVKIIDNRGIASFVVKKLG